MVGYELLESQDSGFSMFIMMDGSIKVEAGVATILRWGPAGAFATSFQRLEWNWVQVGALTRRGRRPGFRSPQGPGTRATSWELWGSL
jgi:hypothetical protein